MGTRRIKCIYLHKWKLVLLGLTFLAQSVFSQDNVLRFGHLTVEDGLSQNTVNGIVKDKYGFMWFGTWSGLCRYDGYKFTIYKNEEGNPHTISQNRIHMVTKDKEGNIWVLPYDTTILCRYNYETDDFTRFPRKVVKKEIADSLSRARNFSRANASSVDNNWHVSRNSLLYQTNNHTRKQIKYIADPLNRWALSDGDVTDIYIDDENLLWVGTYSGGINMAEIGSNTFSYYYRSLKGNNCLIDNNIRTIFQDNLDNLWVGTRSKGITRIDRKNNKYTHYTHIEGNNNSLNNNQIRKIIVDSFGYVWIGEKGGLDRYDQRENRFFHYSTKSKNRIPHDWVYTLMEDDKSNLWIGTWNGIARYNRVKDSFQWYDPKTFKLKRGAVRDFIQDKNKNYWLATEGEGLLFLKRNSTAAADCNLQVVNRYVYSPKNTNSISDNLVYTLCEDETGKIWAGTSNGLDRIDPVNNKIKKFTMKDGLPDVTIMGILSDRNGNVWVSHKKGISRLNIKTLAIKNFGIQNGLQGIEFSENACFRNFKTGEMFFGGTNGLNSFFPYSIKNDDVHLPKVVFTNLKIQNQSISLNKVFNGRIILTRPINLTSEITLNHLDKSFSIEFAGLLYANPKGNKYKHILLGFDKEWITTDATERLAKYSNLDPGNYILEVKASNSDGYWNPTPAILKIRVLPPWWQTLTFRLFFILAGFLLIFLFVYWRVASYRTKEAELNLLIQQRTEELENKNIELLKEQVLIEEQSETLKIANENLKDQQTLLEEYAEETQSQNEKLKAANEQLLEHQAHIEEQSEELRVYIENIKEANDLLIEKQRLIQEQSNWLEESNQKLAILNSTKDRFFSIIAHDLRNPFHAVSGLSEILINDHTKLSAEKIEKFLTLIYTSSISGNNLLENLLQWSRSQTGRISFKPENLVLASLVEENLDLLEVELTRKNITVKSLIKPDTMVFADENMVKTIFRNLISNAIKFTHENGSIKMTAYKLESFIEITVADTGIGISEKMKTLLFNIDTNISTKGTLNESGTGLGLILCKEFTERHGGKIWVESEVDKGSEFKFTLPRS